MFMQHGTSLVNIADELTRRHAPYLPGRTWSDYAVKRILTNPKYKGTVIYNRTTEKLSSKSRRLPESEWVLVPNAFEPIIDAELFGAAQEKLRLRHRNRSKEVILEELKSILRAHGCLSHRILKVHGISPGGIARRFGSLIKAFELAGYQSPHRKTSEHRIQVRMVRAELMQQLTGMFPNRVSIISGSWRHKDFLKLKMVPMLLSALSIHPSSEQGTGVGVADRRGEAPSHNTHGGDERREYGH